MLVIYLDGLLLIKSHTSKLASRLGFFKSGLNAFSIDY